MKRLHFKLHLKPRPLQACATEKFAFPSPAGEGCYTSSQNIAIRWGEALMYPIDLMMLIRNNLKCIGLYLSLFVTTAAFSQSVNDLGKIALAVSMPAAIEGLDAPQLTKLETKITQMVTASGLAASPAKVNFTIYPTFSIIESKVVEGGMAKITTTKVELSLFIKQVDNNIIFSTFTKQITGSGNTVPLSIANAISKISSTDTQFKQFIETGKQKIIQYYETSCSDILTKSESLLLLQNYEQALALLMSVPEEVKCFNTVQDRSIIVYQALQNQKCAKEIQTAKATLAAKKYSEVLDLLGQIDPAASCFAEAQALLKDIEGKISEEEKKEWDLLMIRYQDAVALEKLRIDAIKQIAVSYQTASPAKENKTAPVQTKETEVNREATVVKSTPVVDSDTKKHRYFALLMGVEEYQDPAIASLSEPIKDAGLLKQLLLDKYTFEESNITFLKNPTFEDVSIAFEEMSRKIEPTDYLLIFYAGHGYFDEKTNIGYWLPSDAQKKTTTKWFRNSALVENIRAINSKHTLLIADACFSGGIFKTRAPFNNASPDIADMMRRPSRKAMTSGSLTTVPDKSVFMKYLLRILTENQNKFLPSEDLFDEVKTAMKNNSDTKPLYGEIQNVGDEGGNFVLIRKN